MVGSAPLSAQTFTWDGGGGNANWTTNNNWNPNGAPTASTLTTYIFGGNSRTTNTANGATNWEVNSLTFNNTSGAFTISGTAFNLQAGGITNNDTQTQRVNNALVLQATATMNAASGALALGGNISGAFGITKTGASTLTLSGTNTYTGDTTINAGTLTASGGNAIDNSSQVTLANTAGAILNLAGSETIGNLSGGGSTGGNVTLGANTLTVNQTGTTTYSGVISGTGGLTQTGTGSLTLAGSTANTFTGATAVNDGTLNLNKTAGVNAVGSTAITVGDGSGAAASANLVLLASNQLSNSALVTVNADGRLALNNFSESINRIAGTGLIDLATSGYLTVGGANGSSTFGGSIAGSGTLEKAGTGTLTFNSTISFTGTLTLSGGTLALNGTSLTVDTLHITGNTVLDFGNSTASVLNATTFLIDSGVTLTITNWINATDYFYAQNWTGATPDASGSIPMNQVTFSGFSASNTKWLSFDSQITPVPEPAAYGAAFAGLTLAWTLWRRSRRELRA